MYKYAGMPSNRFNGNVMPSDKPKYKEELAYGIAYRSTAGTAM